MSQSKNLMSMPLPPEQLSTGKISGLLSFMGPGLILASASIGSGEIFFSSRGGAIFGYMMLWTFVLSVIFKGFVVYSGTRYLTITGEHPFTRWGQIFPGPKNWFPVLIGFFAFISFPTWAAGFAKFLGQWSVWTFGFGSDPVWATFWTLLVFASFFLANYDYVEKFQTWVVFIMIVFVLIAMIISKPDWLAVLGGFLPRIPSGYEPWIAQKFPAVASKSITLELAVYLGALGGGTYDYVGYVGLYREKEWGMLKIPNLSEIADKLLTLKKGEMIPLSEAPEDIANTKIWLRAVSFDALVSFFCVFLFSMAFMILGNVILGIDGKQQIPNDNMIMQYQAEFFNMITPAFVYFYKLAVWCAFFGSMQASASFMYANTFRESFGTAFKAIRDEKNWYKVRLFVNCVYCFGGILIVWTGISFTTLVSFGSLIGGVFSIGLWGLAMIYTEHKVLPESYRMSKFAAIMVGISGVVMTIMGFIAILQFFKII